MPGDGQLGRGLGNSGGVGRDLSVTVRCHRGALYLVHIPSMGERGESLESDRERGGCEGYVCGGLVAQRGRPFVVCPATSHKGECLQNGRGLVGTDLSPAVWVHGMAADFGAFFGDEQLRPCLESGCWVGGKASVCCGLVMSQGY
jgi:hypothetical protein